MNILKLLKGGITLLGKLGLRRAAEEAVVEEVRKAVKTSTRKLEKKPKRPAKPKK